MRIAAAIMIAAALWSQQPAGDRPAGNLRGTRSVVLARNGVIATSQPLATAAGLRVLQSGGNAVDAAVTAAMVLSVVEPTMNGPGGDLFAMVYSAKDHKVHALNASGRAGSLATPDEFARRGARRIPLRGELSVTVPGVVDGWNELLTKYGTHSLGAALQPAIRYARDGYAVSEIIAGQWKDVEPMLASDANAAKTFLIDGRAPRPGDVFRNPNLAASLELIAREGRDAFYTGAIGAAIAGEMEKRHGLVTAKDLAGHHGDWVDPISTTYRGYQVLELPPNTQGVAALEMLNILEGYDLAAMGWGTARYLHTLVEAKRIAFADRGAWIGDASSTPTSAVAQMLSKDYAASRRREIDPARASDHRPLSLDGRTTPQGLDEPIGRGDTVYLTAADADGNVVSLIQSLYETFGSGIVAGDTGIMLHDRGNLFTLTPGHPNQIAPGKRPFHTLIPAMVMKDGVPWVSFGVMGGDMQAQGHAQVLVNLIDFGMNIQEAGEAPRFRDSGAGLALESAFSEEARTGLTARGYTLIQSVGVWGGFQGILIDPKTHVLQAGSDPRKDGMAAGW
ncbi:MAG TPA: gamma-glutamyltransferase [Vicinamibacterales bacterium]|jgi:gamma-glutamyltranspeptidase/glutathione hydrolase